MLDFPIQNNRQQTNNLQYTPNYKTEKIKSNQNKDNTEPNKIKNGAIQEKNNLIIGEDLRNHLISDFTTSNPENLLLNQIQFQNPIMNPSK